MIKKDGLFSVDNIVPMEDQVLIQFPQINEKSDTGLILSDNLKHDLKLKSYATILKKGIAFNTGYELEFNVGDKLLLYAIPDLMTLSDFDYIGNASLISRHQIRCKLDI